VAPSGSFIDRDRVSVAEAVGEDRLGATLRAVV
jgi:hypothetical protein